MHADSTMAVRGCCEGQRVGQGFRNSWGAYSPGWEVCEDHVQDHVPALTPCHPALAIHSYQVEVAISEALLNWPYFHDLSLVGAGQPCVPASTSWAG